MSVAEINTERSTLKEGATITKYICNKLYDARVRRNIDINKLATESGLLKDDIIMAEQGSRILAEDELKRVMAVIGISYDDLFPIKDAISNQLAEPIFGIGSSSETNQDN